VKYGKTLLVLEDIEANIVDLQRSLKKERWCEMEGDLVELAEGSHPDDAFSLQFSISNIDKKLSDI